MSYKIPSNINKYYIFIKKKEKLSLIAKNNNKKEIFDILKNKLKNKINKENNSNYSVILLKLKNVKYDINQPIKMIFGPIKVEINFFELSPKGAIKTNKYETRNNHLFFTTKFLDNNKIKQTDLKKIVELAINNKLEKRLLAPKVIEQIFK